VLIFNPFDHVDKKGVKKRVEKLKKKKKNLTPEEICRILIKKKSRWCAAAGALTAFPGAVPVVGTVIAVIGGTLFDMAAMGYLLTELILEEAAVYDRDLDISGTSREAVWVMVSTIGAEAAGRGLTRLTAGQLSGRAFNRLIEQVLISLGVRASQRTVLRIIPFIGMFIAGAVNYYTCRKVGELAMKYYAGNSYKDIWDGETIDASYEITGE